MQRFLDSKSFKISLLIFVVVFIGSHFIWGDLFKLPFDSNLWGNVADWCMVLVTAITARYIWQTLQSQTQVQSDQRKLLTLEQIRITNDLMPSFESAFNHFTPHIYPDEPFPSKFGHSHYIYSISLLFTLNNSTAKQVKIELMHSNGTEWDDEGCGNVYSFPFMNQWNGINLGYNVKGALARYTRDGETTFVIKERVRFMFTYVDQFDNEIIQPIEIDIDTSTTNNIIPHKPVVMKSIF